MVSYPNTDNGVKYNEIRIEMIDKINKYKPKIQELIREKLKSKYGLPDVVKGGKRKSRKQKKSLRRKSRKARKSQKKRR